MDTSRQHYRRHNSALSTPPSLSISTSTSCASSIHTTSLTDSPYYYYSSPTSSPTTLPNPPLQPSYRSLDKRSQSVSVQLRRRTSSPSPPQRSVSACSTLLKEVSLAHHLSTMNQDKNIRYSVIDTIPAALESPPQQQQHWWDDSQLALELADDLPSNDPSFSSHQNIKTKIRKWFSPKSRYPQGNRRLFSNWLPR